MIYHTEVDGFPYCDLILSDIACGNLESNENSHKSMSIVFVYANVSLTDNTCYLICSKTKEIMLKYGW